MLDENVTLRDYFAGQVLCGIYSRIDKHLKSSIPYAPPMEMTEEFREAISQFAYFQADKMLETRSKTFKKTEESN